MIRWNKAVDLLLPELTDCPWPMAESRLILAAREFFTKSGAWRHDLEPFYSYAGIGEYEAMDIPDAEIVRVVLAFFDGNEIEPVTADQWAAIEAKPPYTAGPPKFISYSDELLLVSPAPQDDGKEMRATVTLRPPLNAKGLEDQLWNDYIEAIVEGAKARLYLSQGKPYTETTLAAAASSKFKDAIRTAQWKVAKGQTRGRGRVRAHFF
ncbi:MAG: hypothetical protein ACK5XA_15760 [Tagaea sp.]